LTTGSAEFPGEREIDFVERRPIVSGLSQLGDGPMKMSIAKRKLPPEQSSKKRRVVARLRTAMKMIVDVGT